LDQAFFYAENSGGENDVFEKIALWLNTRNEKKRSICIKLIEPVFISGTGIFLLIFLVNLVLPLFSEGTYFL
jgi:type II secretory pathway component PulF